MTLFSVRLMLRAPVASSEKKTIFGRWVSSIQTTCPIHRHRSCAFMISALMPGMSALRCTSVLETFSSQENAYDLAKASETDRMLSAAFCRASHSHRAGNDNNCLVKLQLCEYFGISLSPYSFPQPAEGSTCLSQSVGHFFFHECCRLKSLCSPGTESTPHCPILCRRSLFSAVEEQVLVQATATRLPLVYGQTKGFSGC